MIVNFIMILNRVAYRWPLSFSNRRTLVRHLNQNEIQAAKNKLIKGVIGVRCKELDYTEEDNGSKRKPSRVLISLMLHRKQ